MLGASGFLGSHITKELVKQGRDVRILVRRSSDIRACRHLGIERFYGDVLDIQSLRDAMQGCDIVYHCVVDTRAWLRNPAPLYQVNVDGLKNSMDAALESGIQRFVYTSTFATIGRNPSGISSENDSFNWWDSAPEYVRCRVKAESTLLEYCQNKAFPGVVCCIGNTYGGEDFAPTPHGRLVRDAAKHHMPMYWNGGGPSVGIIDAAQAMILAESKGKVGERYIIAERWVGYKELFALAAKAAGVAPPKIHMPMFMMYAMAGISEVVTRMLGRENNMSVSSIKCSSELVNTDNTKAMKELGWSPRPIEESIIDAVDFYLRKRT